ncbi:aminotransferase class V-fold PLP-dependent enzyme [Croceitalea rosinachiae]|uniref:Aminotransferase class V-fold PLP-dependent enzyme n=1 Tax=Croceitalea rosinachiae TaxID=3075596 RepID=A0ABU3A6N8_9FLAO|nr:aminotransferase class V-fold PLP-dependent enzyme [Croceitalea sp. F388]MDT0605844.1 aminotransferase class V-fold PLP-dependent enzyme [Croceitalea sp. F388]
MGTTRRKFLQRFSQGTIASLAVPVYGETLGSYWKEVGLHLPNDNSENYWGLVKEQFNLAEGLHYFNNASLGASSTHIQQETSKFRNLLDGFPSKYMWGGWEGEKEKVREKVAQLFSVSSEEIALIHNTTEGMNLIARSFDLLPGDEVVLANHEHSSGRIPWEVWQETKGIKLVRPELPLLPEKVTDLVEVYKKAITQKTKVISMCHMVNTNGMLLPVKEVSEMAHEKGILVAVDGAQTAGMFTIDLNDLGCDFYTASAHKWLFSPKGVGIFYAKQESQHYLKPLMVARGHTDKSIRRLENYNTRNLPEVLGLGASVDFHNIIGPERIHERTFELKRYFRSKIENDSRFSIKSPKTDELSAAIQVVEVNGKEVDTIKQELWDEYGIDCRPMSSHSLNALRLSFAIYITKKDIDYLVEALQNLA